MSPDKSIAKYKRLLAEKTTTSRALVEECLANASAEGSEGPRVFLKLYRAEAPAAADAADRARGEGVDAGPLRGIPISIKDLFDVAGESTCAGSVVLADAPPAPRDAAVVSRLREAGAVVMGRTNMTEFAFSGLGLNPHYGTPRSPYDREVGRIAGGSSSGAAVSVCDGMAAAAIGSDTGGSIRIPAALCGLTGFKPTARRVPRAGMLPLSTTLDSVGWIAPSVACCAELDAVLADGVAEWGGAPGLAGVRLGVLQGYLLDGLDREVARAFERSLSAHSRAGANVVEVRFAELDEIPECNRQGGFSAYESYQWHRELIAQRGAAYDHRVLTRIVRGREITDAEYEELTRTRERIIASADRAFAEVNIWLAPTVPRIAPRIADLDLNDEVYFETNAAMLRNPSVFNFLDGCSLSLPCHVPGDAPVGVMLSARGGEDARLLRIGAAVEGALYAAGCATPGRNTR